MEGTGDYMNKNQNIRFNMDKESDIMAWESLHSKDVGERFKSQNRFVIEAINYYYERVIITFKDNRFLLITLDFSMFNKFFFSARIRSRRTEAGSSFGS